MINQIFERGGVVWESARRNIFSFAMTLALAVIPLSLHAQSVTLAWSPSITPDVVGYMIYWSADGTNFNSELDAGTNTAATVTGLTPGSTNYFEVIAYESGTNQSPPSTELEYIVPATVENVIVAASPVTGGNLTGGGSFLPGSTAVVLATANTGYTFANWTENGTVQSTSPSYSFILSTNRTLVANFTANVGNYSVTTQINPANGGSVSGSGSFTAGSSVTATATANSGYTFTSWTENGIVQSTSANYTFAIATNRNLAANFTVNPIVYTVATQINPANSGTASGSGSFTAGSSVTATATANSGYTFTNWTENGIVQSSLATYTFIAAANRNLVANFTANPVTYNVVTQITPANAGSVTGGGSFTAGTSVTLSAIANNNYTFLNWTENGTVQSTSANYTFTVATNRNLVADFAENASTNTLAVTNGLVAYYPLSSNGIDSWAGKNLTLVGSPSFSADAVNWNGSVPTLGYTAPQQWPQSGLTVSAWINMSDPTANYIVAGCYGNYSAPLGAAYFQFGTLYGGLIARVVQNADVNYIGRTTVDTLTTGWHFVAFTWSGGTTSSSIKVYLDGAQVDNADNNGGTFTGAYSGSNVPLSVGAQLSTGYGLGARFYGSEREVLMYNRALSQSEIGTLYTNAHPTGIASTTTLASSQNPALAGNAVTFTAAVSGTGGIPTGTVIFYDGSTNLGNAALNSSGLAAFSTSTLSAGSSPHSITAVYSGDTTFGGSSSSALSQDITNLVFETVAAQINPAHSGTVSGSGSFSPGSSVTVTAIANSGYAFSNWTENGTVQSASANYTFVLATNRSLVANFSLSSVTYTVATQMDPANSGTISGSGSFTAGSSVTVSAIANSDYTFANWTENGQVQSTSASYTFTLNTNRNLVAIFIANISSLAVTNGLVAYYPLSSNEIDSWAGKNLTLVGSPSFSADAVNWNGSVPTLGYTAPQQWPQSGLTVSAWINMSDPTANYIVAGCYGNYSAPLGAAYFQFGTLYGGLIARVVQNADVNYIGRTTVDTLTTGWHFVAFTWSGGTTSSSIKVYLDGAQVDNADNNGGTFTGAYSGSNVPLSVGAQLSTGYGLGARFYGSEREVLMYNRALSQSEIGTLYTNAHPTTIASTTTLASSQNPALAGNAVTFTATVSGTGGTPTGTVIFYDGSTNLGNAALNSSGLAAFSTSALSAGSSPHSITAVYSGDTTFGGGTSSVLSQNITNPVAIPITYTVSPSADKNGSINPSEPQMVPTGGNIIFTATPATNYQVSQWTVNGTVVQSGGSAYTLQNVTSSSEVGVSFSAIPIVVTNSVASPISIIKSSTPFTLVISGNGTLTTNRQIAVAQSNPVYNVTATPAKGSVFADWVSNGVVVATSPKYTISVQSNVVLQANFIANPFPSAAGSYHGLFYVTNDAAPESSGSFAATVTASGAFSAQLHLGNWSGSYAEKFSVSGAAYKSIPRPGLSPITIQLQLDLTNGPLTGTISDGAWTADLLAMPAVYGQTNPAPQAGKYTLLIPGSDNASTQPGGNGFGTLTVNALGHVTFSGMLGDGTPVTSTGVVAGQGQWPFYISLYGGKGSILGWLSFTNESAISGQVGWFKLPKITAKLYPGGFTNNAEIMGSIYRHTNGLPVLDLTNCLLSLTNGDLAQGILDQMVIAPNDKATDTAGDQLTFKAASGLFKGTEMDPTTGKPIALNGVVLQNQNFAAGLFLGANETGSVVLSTTP